MVVLRRTRLLEPNRDDITTMLAYTESEDAMLWLTRYEYEALAETLVLCVYDTPLRTRRKGDRLLRTGTQVIENWPAWVEERRQ